MARILIIGSGHLCRNPRMLKEAQTLCAAGHDVTVLTVSNHAPSEQLDRDLLKNAPFRRVTVDMLDHRWVGRLRVNFDRIVAWLGKQAVRYTAWQTPFALGAASRLYGAALNVPADLTIVHTELPMWIGLRLLKKGRKVAADFEDWHSEDLLPANRVDRPLNLIRAIEKTLIQQAAYCSTTSEALAGSLHRRYEGRRPLVFTNSFPLQNYSTRVLHDSPIFFWFSQTIGPGRGLEHFLDAWALTVQSSRVVLLGQSYGEYKANLLERLSPDFRARVSFLPMVSPSVLPDVIARHDIGLALEEPSIVNRDLTITNKILQYLNAGLAVVAFVRSRSIGPLSG